MTESQLAILRAYSAGERGTRDTIEALGMEDYADLLIALARHGLKQPKPRPDPEREARVRAILEPLLHRG